MEEHSEEEAVVPSDCDKEMPNFKEEVAIRIKRIVGWSVATK